MSPSSEAALSPEDGDRILVWDDFGTPCQILEEFLSQDGRLALLACFFGSSVWFMSKTPPIPAPLKPFRKSAWKPQVEETAGERTQSKFGGQPWIPPGQPWPECPNCSQPMQLFVQLNLNQLPDDLAGEFGDSGLLQLFYCINDEMTCAVEQEGWQAFSPNSIVRIVELEDDQAPSEEHDVESEFPEKVITGWTEILDYPDPEEAEDMGADLSDDDWDTLDKIEEKGVSTPRDGDKLSGWPFWAQAANYPDCPVCAGRMQMIMQLDSGDHLPFSFGDAGCGHITQCEMHPEQVTFSWACA